MIDAKKQVTQSGVRWIASYSFINDPMMGTLKFQSMDNTFFKSSLAAISSLLEDVAYYVEHHGIHSNLLDEATRK